MDQIKVNAFCDHESTNRADALLRISEEAYKSQLCKNPESVYNALMTREKQGSTAFIPGVSLPHAISSEIVYPSVLVARYGKSIPWSTHHDEEDLIQLAICLLMPDGDSGKGYLKDLSRIASYLSDKEHVDYILSESDLDKVCSVFQSVFMSD